MSRTRTTYESKLQRTLSKVFVSGFVVLSFVAYVVTQHTSDPGQASSSPSRSTQPVLANPQIIPTRSKTTQAAAPTAVPTLQRLPTAVRRTSAPPTLVPPSPTAALTGGFRDGSYTGQVEDAYYGLVQVKAVISGGKITDVQILNYPRDRRTSQQINSIAIPYLQQEVIQAQNANVDLISGATLTSEAFVRSLQTALDTASTGS